MTTPSPLLSFYSFRRDFSYLKYLETKSHFDRLEVGVDRNIKKLIASNEKLAERHLSSDSAISQQLTSGFDRLSARLESVNDSINNLASICEYGFVSVTLSLANLNDSITELVKLTKTPEQTWALEQFSIARDAFRKGLMPEALEHVNRAISGYRGRTGYPLDYRFYMLRGFIHLGSYKNIDAKFVDLNRARDEFLLAARYSGEDSVESTARCIGLAGWCCYCLGNMQEAQAYLRDSVAKNPLDGLSTYDLAKVLLHQGRIEDAMTFFARSIRLDGFFGLKASADDVFLNNKPSMTKAIEDYRKELISDIFALRDECKSIAEKISSLHKYSYIGQVLPATAKVDISDLKSKPIIDLNDELQHFQDLNRVAHTTLGNKKQELKSLVASLRSQKPRTYRDYFAMASFDGKKRDLANLLGLTVCLLTWWIAFSEYGFFGLVGIPLGFALGWGTHLFAKKLDHFFWLRKENKRFEDRQRWIKAAEDALAEI